MALVRSLPIGYSQRHGVKPYFRVHFRNYHLSCRVKCSSWDIRCAKLWGRIKANPRHRSNSQIVVCSAAPFSAPANDVIKAIAQSCTRALSGLNAYPILLNSAPAVGVLLFSAYALIPCMQLIRRTFLKKDRNWDKSQMKHIVDAYIRPLLLWVGLMSISKALDPVVLSSTKSQAIKERLLNFVRSLSTVLAFAVCTTNLTQEIQKSLESANNTDKGRDLSIQFVGNAVCSSVWVAAVCLFMELLGFSTQKLITAGGFGTVLVTLAGREIFTNFLSSVMIHATRPFTVSQWIQTKIEGQEVSGTVEHVGWWSPTIVRGDDREAVHIPNHKFTVSVVRNLSQKTHWRIKTHLAISHLDVAKLNPIIADMRKVLAKQPNVEHKRLHRRVFLDSVHPENQALLILVSCFVKTGHFEEYLRVKETILLDLLRVISHHNARLATPIRSVQRVSSDDSHQSNSRYEYERPLLLPGSAIQSRTSSEDKQGSRQTSNETANVSNSSSDMEQQASRVAVVEQAQAEGPKKDFDADNLIEVKPQPRKIFVQDHVEEQIVGNIMAGDSSKSPASQDILVLGPTISSPSVDSKVGSPEASAKNGNGSSN